MRMLEMGEGGTSRKCQLISESSKGLRNRQSFQIHVWFGWCGVQPENKNTVLIVFLSENLY